mmetsp:Transcript_61901/g.114888  ORF Transcript_61901/g.114888 Transcript_61901/m.114888 type:complete len:221 (-) Transcript_61901:41-703(-)
MHPHAGHGTCSRSKSAPLLVAKSAHCLLRKPSKHCGQKWCKHDNVKIASPAPASRPQSAHTRAGRPMSIDITSLDASRRSWSNTSNDSHRGSTIAVKLVRNGPEVPFSLSFRISGPVPPAWATSSDLGACRGALSASIGTPGKDLKCCPFCIAAFALRHAATSTSRALASCTLSAKLTSSALDLSLPNNSRLKPPQQQLRFCLTGVPRSMHARASGKLAG